MKPARPLLAALVSLLGAVSCATFDGKPGEPDYATDAETNLQRGEEAFGAHQYLEAEKYYEHVRSKFPFSEASKEAELRLGDSLFERDKFLEARDVYQTFIKLHPTHPRVDYAAYRAAFTHYKEVPGDLIILPPAREKDQAELQQTLRQMNEFLRLFPKSQYFGEATALRNEVLNRLADHELYVAEFYRKRERWPAVAGRLETLLQRYPGSEFEQGALFGLHEAYSKLKEPEKAKGALQRILEKFPGSSAADKAQRLLN